MSEIGGSPYGVEITIHREDPGTSKGTPGVLAVTRGDSLVFQCRTLELPDLDNKRDISCIPAGKYQLAPRCTPEPTFAGKAKARWGHRFGFHVQGVEGRSLILLHWGNYLSSTAGCCLLGLQPGVIQGESGPEHCVWRSVAAYRAFYRAVEGFYEEGKPPSIEFLWSTNEEEPDLSMDRSKI